METSHIAINTLKKGGAALTLLAVLQGSALAANITVYTDKTAWTAAVGSFVTEDFSDSSLQSPLTGILGDGTIGSGTFNDVANNNGAVDTVFNYNPGVYGVGGDWDLFNPAGPGSGLSVTTFNGTYDVGDIANTYAGEFWGFTIDETISSILISEDYTGSGYKETYILDNMVMATSPVPIPAAAWLFGSGLIGLVGIARRKKA